MMTLPTDFWCEDCKKWTKPEPTDAEPDEPQPDPVCGTCGEAYQCGECGYEIDRAGNCQRPEGHTPPDTEKGANG